MVDVWREDWWCWLLNKPQRRIWFYEDISRQSSGVVWDIVHVVIKWEGVWTLARISISHVYLGSSPPPPPHSCSSRCRRRRRLLFLHPILSRECLDTWVGRRQCLHNRAKGIECILNIMGPWRVQICRTYLQMSTRSRGERLSTHNVHHLDETPNINISLTFKEITSDIKP